jgi:peptidoglycan/LPS O-acetylase OafA/YrhL
MPLDTRNRISSLDGLRAISIACVLLAHLSGTRNFFRSDVFELYGNFGVRVFFVISGYLITTLLLKEHERTGSISLREFYLRRAYRILPAAYTFMVVVIAAQWRALFWPNILTAVTYTSNYYHGGNWLLGHLWSLSVEEQFYLLWPLTLLLVFRRRLWIVAGLVLAGPPLRVLFWMLWGHRGLAHPFPVVMDALAAGCALAMLQPHLRRYDHLLRQRRFLIVPCLTALTPLSYQIAGLTILHLGIALSIQHAVHVRYRVLNLGPVVWLGALSYSLYLWQQPFLNRGSTAWWTAFPLNLALALLCAAASHYLVERPFLALRERSRKEAKVVFPERIAMSGGALSEDLASCAGRPSSAA